MSPTSHRQRSTSHAPLKNNVGLTLMYWHIGERINREVLGNERATYGKQIVATVSRQMQRQLHKGLEVARQQWKDFTEDYPLKIVLPNMKSFVSLQREKWHQRTRTYYCN